MSITFKDLPLLPLIQETLEKKGFVTPTEIQGKALPLLLANHRVDVHGQAQTGTGKTLAFGLPLLHHIDPHSKVVQSLIVAPTRELVIQICESLEAIAQPLKISILAIYGGSSMQDQLRGLKKGPQIIVGTPGRLNDHLRRKSLKLDQLTTLVLDEADIMLDMGFRQEVDEILFFCPPTRNIWLFSATVKPGIAQLMQTHLKNPLSIRVSKQQVSNVSVKHFYCTVSHHDRLNALCRFIDHTPQFYGFVFCQTKLLAAELAEQLMQRGYKANALHGDMSQGQRNRVIEQFKSKECLILIATDVAARGIDIADLTHVINYSIPEDHESYIHRAGRTGRAGKEGIAISFMNHSDRYKVSMIKRKFNVDLQPLTLPTLEDVALVRLNQVKDWLNSFSEETELSKKIHTQQLHNLISDFPAPLLTKVLASLLDEKFFKHLVAKAIAPAQGSSSYAKNGSSAYTSDDNQKELVFNIGSDDGITKSDILEHILKNSSLEQEHISKVKVINKRSFIVVTKEKSEQVFQALKGKDINGKRARIDYTNEKVRQYCA